MDKSREDDNKNDHVMILSSSKYNDNDNTMQLLKRKRTKRQRLATTTATVPLTMTGGNADDKSYVNLCTDIEFYRGGVDYDSTMVLDGYEEEGDEEEDLANCLILLAQGKSLEAEVVVHNSVRDYVYQCKTCDRCFSSFQALGGHRASHKKPKPNGFDHQVVEVKKRLGHQGQGQDHGHHHDYFTALTLQISNTCKNTTHKLSKVHECSICGAEFSSGQALGGHMRRHRSLLASTPISTATLVTSNHDHHHVMCPKIEEKKLPSNVFSLDLNLPAAAEDQDHIIQRESKFAFESKQVIAFC